MIQIISTMSELGAGTRGASLGLDALKFASLHSFPSFFTLYLPFHIPNNNEILFDEISNIELIKFKEIINHCNRLSSVVENTLLKEQFPVVISGDHSNANGTIKGIQNAFPNKKLGVIWIDAHADLHSPFTSPSGNTHGMVLASALNKDFKELKIRDISTEMYGLWEQYKIKNTTLGYQNIAFFGLRDCEPLEIEIIKTNNIFSLSVEKYREFGVKNASKLALDSLSQCDIIYVSFDVDSLDPDEVSYGTGTPVKKGFTLDEAEQLLVHLSHSPKVVTLEFTEINPLLDNKGNKMAESSFYLLKKCIEIIENK